LIKEGTKTRVADIRPFRGVHYNGSLIKDWSDVICPPYDIISPQQQQELYSRSEHNFIRLEFDRELPQDTATDNKYSRAAATLEQWLKQGILKVDETPAIYLHDQYFSYQGREYKRRGITVQVRLEEWDKMVVRPHEGTMSEPKGDRLSLLWALQTNTSPILSLFEGQGQKISSVLAKEEKNAPMISSGYVDGERHNVWAITDPGAIAKICAELAEKPVYIADGHHRYESALTYKQEKLAYSSTSSDDAFNFVMMTLVDFSDPGLLILPPHRLVRGIHKPAMAELMSELGAFFDIEKLALNKPDVWQQVDTLLAESDEVRLGLFGLDTEHLFILSVRDFAAVNQMMPYFHSELYKRLDVSVIDHVILEELLAPGGDREHIPLDYSYDRQDAVKRVLNEEYQLALLLRPVKPELIKTVADAGEKMPRKSTYFYPKLPAGLILNRLV